MPSVNDELDVVIIDDARCAKCGAPCAKPEDTYCRKCIEEATKPPEPSPEQERKTNEAVKELARRELARRHLIPFVKYFDKKYKAGWVHQDIAARLERFLAQVVAGESPRLILNMPPRHGKSRLATQEFSAWALGRYPWLEFISTSHTASLQLDFSRTVRGILEDQSFKQLFPESRVDPGNRDAAGWRTTAGGGFLPAGVGGAITGRGAHVLVVDDFIKNSQEAQSDTVRNAIAKWYNTTAYSRLAPGGGVLIIATLWHLDDLVGRIEEKMAEGGDQFEIVRYPAIADDDEYRLPSGQIVHTPAPDAVLLRKAGEALHPQRYPLEALERIKKTMSGGEWSALYQQSPVSGETSYYAAEDIEAVYYDDGELPSDLVYYQAWDVAIGRNEENDSTVGLTGGVDAEDTLWLVDRVKGKFDGLQLVESILDAFEKWYPEDVGLEKEKISMAIGPFLDKMATERELHGFNSVELPPGKRDKVARSRPSQGRLRQKKIRIPRNAPWTDDFVKNLLEFPVGKHDDDSDAFAWLGQMLDMMGLPSRRGTGEKKKSWRDKLPRFRQGYGGPRRDWRSA